MTHGMTMMAHRQQQATFQVFDGPQKFDATPSGFTTYLLSGISEETWPLPGTKRPTLRAISSRSS